MLLNWAFVIEESAATPNLEAGGNYLINSHA
jgi:hypothetical protein